MNDNPRPSLSGKTNPALGLLCIFTATLLWGSLGVITKKLSVPSLALAFWRSAFAALFLFFLLLCRRRRPLTTKKDLPWLMISGSAIGLCWCCMFLSIQAGTVSLGIMLIYCAPLFVILLSPLLFNEHLSPKGIISCLSIALGLVLISLPGLSGGTSPLLAVLWGLAGAFFYSFMPLIGKKHQSCDGLENTFIQMASATCTVGLWAWLSDVPLSLPLNTEGLWVCIIGLVHTGFGMWLYFTSLRHLSVQHVALCSYMEPLSALGWSALLLGERLTDIQWIGCLLVLGTPVLLELYGKLRGRSKTRFLGGTMPRQPQHCESCIAAGPEETQKETA